MCAKYAPVAPINVLEYLNEQDAFGTYHLFLAHEVVKTPKRHKALMDSVRGKASHPRNIKFNREVEIIMDNSVVELGNAVDASMLKDAVEIVGAKWLVLPDVFHDATATIQASLKAWEQLEGMQFKGQYMFLAQGTTIYEYVEVLEFFARYPEIKIGMVGIPRNAVKALGTRIKLLGIARAIFPHTPIHLFGFSDNVVDDVMCARSGEKPYGIDSAVPIRIGSEGVDFRIGTADTIPPRDPQWWDNSKIDRTIISNINYAKKLVER